MRPIAAILEERISAAIAAAAPSGPANPPAIVKPTQDAKFGDYQANGIMSLAKQLKSNPRQLAEEVLGRLDLSDMCEPPEIASPGFINLRLKPEWVAAELTEAIAEPERLGVDAIPDAPITVIDFSGPNVAKQMHVGHLRSTIIGDVIARVLEFWYNDSAKVIRQNHLGDWGLQMGMVVHAMERAWIKESVQEYGPNEPLRGRIPIDQLSYTLEELEWYYKDINEEVSRDPEAAQRCRDAVVRLQQKLSPEYDLWKKARDISVQACNDVYQQLNVCLGDEHICGESFYAEKLSGVISELRNVGLLQSSQGAQCVFLDGFKAKEGEPLPLIVRKSDDAFLYATTDLAAIRYRTEELKAQRIIYVTDARQKLHFQMIFACARAAGWADENVQLEHVPFGSVLGDDNRPFKTRSGENVKLKELLDEAEKRALAVVKQKNPDLPSDQKKEIAHAVGIGAVKYADLSNNLVSDYVFGWDKMLAMEGNTAPYLQYAYARIRSIFRKGGIDLAELLAGGHCLELTEPDELTLTKLLLRYGEVIESVVRDLRPHLLTTYLFDLAQSFSSFYANCPVLKAGGAVRTSRLLLCHQAASVLAHALGLLGIETIEQM